MSLRPFDARHPDRPWPRPARAPLVRMSWRALLFAHWRVAPGALARLLPPGLELETFDGAAWLGIVPFEMRDTTHPAAPPLPVVSHFAELNVRTYVRAEARPGVWFFSLDAESRLTVLGARTFFHLPYFFARMRRDLHGDEVRYSSRRLSGRSPAEFRGRYRPAGEPSRAAPGSLEEFLAERYCLYAADGDGRLFRGEIDHAPWDLQPAEAAIVTNTMARPLGLELAGTPDHLAYAGRQDVVAWSLDPVGGG